ncbi:MAG TPA: hypothetical protein VFD41_07450 [Actinomycetales bacterium]|nr:hypothetical protein [Actinomycetales bacterium]
MRAFLAPALPPARLAVLRVCVYLFAIVHTQRIANDPLAHADVPASLYTPTLLRDWAQLPAAGQTYMQVLQVVLVASALVAATGRFPRLAGWVCFLAVLDWQTNNFAYGKVDHDSFALIAALAVLPTVGRASWRRWRPEDGDERVGWALRAVQMAVVASYFLAALAKFRYGGPGWANGAIFSWAFSRRGSELALELAAVPYFLKIGQWVLLLAELSSPAMLWLRGRWIWLAVGFWVSFHLVTYVVIGIHFMALAVCLVAFLPVERAGELVAAVRAPRAARAAQPADEAGHASATR